MQFDRLELSQYYEFDRNGEPIATPTGNLRGSCDLFGSVTKDLIINQFKTLFLLILLPLILGLIVFALLQVILSAIFNNKWNVTAICLFMLALNPDWCVIPFSSFFPFPNVK